MSAQLELRPVDWRAVWDGWRKILRDVVDYVGVKQVAYDLDVSKSQLLDSLDCRDRHHVRAEWIPYLLMHAPTDAALAYLASLRGLELAEPDPVTPADELRALRAELDEQLGPEVKRTIFARAKARAANRKR